MKQCEHCRGFGLAQADPKQLDEIDMMLVRMMGKERIKKICRFCHGKGYFETEHEEITKKSQALFRGDGMEDPGYGF